jgi:hypothetical protein
MKNVLSLHIMDLIIVTEFVGVESYELTIDEFTLCWNISEEQEEAFRESWPTHPETGVLIVNMSRIEDVSKARCPSQRYPVSLLLSIYLAVQNLKALIML